MKDMDLCKLCKDYELVLCCIEDFRIVLNLFLLQVSWYKGGMEFYCSHRNPKKGEKKYVPLDHSWLI